MVEFTDTNFRRTLNWHSGVYRLSSTGLLGIYTKIIGHVWGGNGQSVLDKIEIQFYNDMINIITNDWIKSLCDLDLENAEKSG